MRVAVIRRRIHSFGGAEAYADKLINGLEKRGVDVEVIAEEYCGKGKAKFYPVRLPRFSLIPGLILFNIACRKILEKEKFDIVHSLERTWPQDIYRAGEGCHREFMKTLSFKERISPKHSLMLYMEKNVFNNSRYIMANSERVKREIIAHYHIPEGRIKVIYTGVDTEKFNPLYISNLKKDEFSILFAGSGFKRKGLELLIKALAKTGHTYFRLLVAGKGDSGYYNKLARSLGISGKIKFLGIVKEMDMLYASADLVVLPTLYEPFSNVCLEAMACGIPALTTRVNGVSEILEGNLKELIIEDPFDTDEISNKLKVFSSKDKREAFSPAVRQLAEKLSLPNHIDEVIKLYESVMQDKRGDIKCRNSKYIHTESRF